MDPQKPFFDFTANNPGDPSSLEKYYRSYHAGMIYRTSQPSLDSSELVMNFPPESIFAEYQYHYPDYGSFYMYDPNTSMLYFMHSPDLLLHSLNIQNETATSIKLELPDFNIEFKTNLSEGMPGGQVLQKARILNASITALTSKDDKIYVQYRLGLPEQSLFETKAERVNRREYRLAVINKENRTSKVYKLPNSFETFQGADHQGQLLFKSKMEHPEYEVFYVVDSDKLTE